MRSIFTLILSTIFLLTVHAQDYFWVGNGGDWTDPSHWATTSGGSEFHTEAPGQSNDVYFDENSFTLPNQDVHINEQNVYCQNFTTEGVTNNPTFVGDAYNYALRVHGNFVITEGALRDFAWIVMSGENGPTQVVTSNIGLGSSSNLIFGSETYSDYELVDSISVGSFGVSRGALYTNGNPIYCAGSLNSNYGPERAMYLSNSNIYCHRVNVNGNMVMDADEASFYVGQPGTTDDFQGGGHEYGYVELSGSFEMRNDNVFGTLRVHPGSNISLEGESIQTADQFYFEGTADDPITITSSEAGTQATLNQISGSVDGNFLVLRDNIATGGATFTADNSIDLGNNEGWDIIENLPSNYYWIGGTGNWSDLNHWATTSGGAELHSSFPSPQDTVIIDANSFSDAGTLTIDEEVSVADFRMDGVFAGATIDADFPVHIYGDFIGSGDVVAEFQEVFFDGAPGPFNITSNDMYWGPQSELSFVSGGAYFFQDDVNAQAINVDGGAAIASGITLNMDWQIRVQSVSNPYLDLSGSTVNCNFWRPYDTDANSYNLDGAVFYCNNQFEGNDLNYDEVHLSGNVDLSGDAAYGLLVLMPGLNLTIEAGTTHSVIEMIAMGTAEELITIRSTEPGQEAFFEGNFNDVWADYLDLQDNHAIGTADFEADNSVFGSNVEGWQDVLNINERAVSLKVYPNPVQETMWVSGITGVGVMEIFNPQGQLIKSVQLNYQGDTRIDLSDFSPGMYQLVLVDETGAHKKTILKN